MAINIARFIFVIGVLFIHFHITPEQFAMEGIFIDIQNTPVFNLVNANFFLPDAALQGLFFLSAYLFFYNLKNFEFEDYDRKICNRIKSLVVPFLVWNVIWLVYTFLKNYYLREKGVEPTYEFNSIIDYIRCFWALGQGDEIARKLPIAGYTWFLRDLFVFALLSPVYYFVLKKEKFHKFSLLLATGLWFLPFLSFYNSNLFFGAYLGYKKISITNIMGRVRWNVLISVFLIVNILHYYCSMMPSITIFFVVVVTVVLVVKISLCITDNDMLNHMAKTSTFLYVTHILVINIGRHFIFKGLSPTNDVGFVMCYVTNAIFCVSVCLFLYYLLKKINANRSFEILTGGRY